MTVIFRHLVRGDNFPACWRLADVVPKLKGSSFSDVGDSDRLISITVVLSKVFEKIVAAKLSNFLKCTSLLPSSQCSYRRGLGTFDALLTLSDALLTLLTLGGGMEGRLVLIDFSAAFDRVSHRCLWYTLTSNGVGG